MLVRSSDNEEHKKAARDALDTLDTHVGPVRDAIDTDCSALNAELTVVSSQLSNIDYYQTER